MIKVLDPVDQATDVVPSMTYKVRMECDRPITNVQFHGSPTQAGRLPESIDSSSTVTYDTTQKNFYAIIKLQPKTGYDPAKYYINVTSSTSGGLINAKSNFKFK